MYMHNEGRMFYDILDVLEAVLPYILLWTGQ